MASTDELQAMEGLITSLFSMGGTGIFFAILLWVGQKQHETHKVEREEWRKDTKEVNMKFLDTLEKSTATLEKINQNIISKTHCNFTNSGN